MAINFADGSTQNHGSKLVQVKDISWTTKTRVYGTNYFFGSANDATYSFTPKNSNNVIVAQFNLMFGRCNINGKLAILINGGTDTGGHFFWSDRTTSSYISGYQSYSGGFNTADDSISTTQDYSIIANSFTLVKNMSCTWPSTFYLGGYFYSTDSSGAYVNLNRQHNDNGGHAVSNIMIYEYEDMS